MRKLKLDLDALEVESFDATVTGDDERGTVNAHAEYTWSCPSTHPTWYEHTCDEATCHYSCERSCFIYDSCDGTCRWIEP